MSAKKATARIRCAISAAYRPTIRPPRTKSVSF